MGKNKWTEEQAAAIEARDCSLVVSAAAGSGKTSVLVERLIRIIADSERRVPVEKMIVATFTNNAAAEMKQRLSAALSALIYDRPSDPWLARQNSMLGFASISTISSFCMELLRKNISRLSFSAGFRVADDAEEAVLKTNAYSETAEYFYKKRHDDMMILKNNFCGVSDYKLEALTYDLWDDVSSVPFFELCLKSAAENYSRENYERLYVSLHEEDIRRDTEICRKTIKSAREETERLGIDKVTALVIPECTAFEQAYSFFEKDDTANFVKALPFEFDNFPPLKNCPAAYVKALRESYKNMIPEIRKNAETFMSAESDRKRNLELIAIMSDFLKFFSERLMEHKVRKNVIGFDDAESLALRLLADIDNDGNIVRTPLAEELSLYYELIMIDEFQDSNNRQDMIFRLLSRNGTPENYGSNLFFVGDVKQSIYRFRLANPDNFIKAMDNSQEYKKDSKVNSHIRLSRNFRSSKEVIDFSNYIFGLIMSRSCGDIDYNEKEYLYQGAQFPEADRAPVVMLFDKSDKKYENTEARIVAEKISDMLKKGVPVNDGRGGTRPCEMKDFCILMRGNKNIGVYAKELERLGISAGTNPEAGYLRAREISVMINILKVIDNPLLDVPLMSVMLSPMFMFTPDEAARVRLINKRSTSIYTNLIHGLGYNSDSDQRKPLFEGTLLEKAENLYARINEFRLYAGVYTIQELIRKIYSSTGFMYVMQLYSNAGKKKANLRMLLEYVGKYEKNSDGGLSGFVRYINTVMESGGDFASAPDSQTSQNIVSIMTMHKSKGMEFPFVFIVGTHTRFNKFDNTKPFQFSYERGIGFKLQNPKQFECFPSLSYRVIEQENTLKSKGEEMRLLYVALTRAKERLFITMNRDKSAAKKAAEFAEEIYACGGITPELVSDAKSMSDWLLMCLISHSKSAKLREYFEIYESFRYDNDFEIEYELSEPAEDEQEEIITDTDTGKACGEYDEEITEKLRRMLKADTDSDLSLSAVTAKLSVSDIAKDESEYDTYLKTPDFLHDSKELTAAEKGTAVHKFMEFADFSVLANEDSFITETDRLCEEGHLTQAEADYVKKSDVKNLAGSTLYRRICESTGIQRERGFLIAISDLGLDDETGRLYNGTTGMLNGVIDMILEYEDHLVLVDYKTDHVKDINKLSERYSNQLILYKKALGIIEKKPVTEAIIYSFYLNREIKITEKKP